VIEESALMLRNAVRGKNNGAWAWNLLTRRSFATRRRRLAG
jgi:hypothetical protein